MLHDIGDRSQPSKEQLNYILAWVDLLPLPAAHEEGHVEYFLPVVSDVGKYLLLHYLLHSVLQPEALIQKHLPKP